VALSWSALKNPTGIVLSGMAPSAAAKAAVAAAAVIATTGTVTDNLVVQGNIDGNIASPPDYAAATNFALGQLAALSTGQASLNGPALVITGNAPNAAIKTGVDAALAAALPAGMRLARADVVAPAPPPPPPPPPVVAAPPPPPPPPPVALSWSAVKNPTGIVLSGMAPSAAAKAAVAAAAVIATTGTVTDNLVVQGNIEGNIASPSDYAAATNFALGQLAALSTGQASLNGPALVVTGNAPNAAIKTGVDAALAAALPAGMRLARADVVAPAPPPPPPPPPPVVAAPPPPQPVPLVWAAAKDNNGITLTGLVPSDAVRSAIIAAARAATTGAVIDNMRLQAVVATPPDQATSAAFALQQLGRLSTGQAALAGPALTLSGIAGSPDAKRMVDQAMTGTLPGAARLAQVGVAVRPYAMEAQADKSGIALTGYVPDQATRTELVNAAEAAGFRGKIRDELQIVGGAPANFGGATRVALSNLLRLDLGTVRVDDQTISLQGMTCRDVIKQEVETGSRVGLPVGFAGQGQVSIRQTGCTNCQLELDSATKGRAILFQQSSDELAADASTIAVVDEVARVLQACPTARIAVEGHTNLDGERRGYPNKTLSEKRAEAVIGALVARGVAANRFMPVGFGADKPLIPHGTAAAREQNRRVQFTIVNP
jgi:outer membrane protein OmpA-like peptidoglycan-associated protein